MIRWEVAIALVIGCVGALVTRQVMQANRGLEVEIAERRRTEVELRTSEAKRIKALRESDALKSALLSSVSHELRTPLTAIKAMVFSLGGSGDDVTPEIRGEFLQGIHQEIDYLSRLVDNLLDMSKIEAGTFRPLSGNYSTISWRGRCAA
jgi:K+-sensing histidine kinase KdpD